MSELYSPETSAAMQRDIAAWTKRKTDARVAIEELLSELLDSGVTVLQLGQVLSGIAGYGFQHRDGRRFGWEIGGWPRNLQHKPEEDKSPS